MAAGFRLGNGAGVVVPGQAGWLYWQLGDRLDVRVRTQLKEGSLRISAILVQSVDGGSVTGSDLRLPLMGRLEAALGRPDVRDVALKAGRSRTGPDFRMDRCTTAEAKRHLAKADIRDLADDAGPSLRIDIPRVRRRDDEFYLSVALVYSLAAAISPRPAIEMAQANDVPVSTIHRWLKEYRRRMDLKDEQRRERIANDSRVASGQMTLAEYQDRYGVGEVPDVYEDEDDADEDDE